MLGGRARPLLVVVLMLAAGCTGSGAPTIAQLEAASPQQTQGVAFPVLFTVTNPGAARTMTLVLERTGAAPASTTFQAGGDGGYSGQVQVCVDTPGSFTFHATLHDGGNATGPSLATRDVAVQIVPTDGTATCPTA